MDRKHAYCIIAHQDPIMIAVMVAMLDHPLNDIYIHIDKKVDIAPFQGIRSQWSQIFFLPNRISVEWGNTSQIETELLIFEYAFNHGDYSYFHMMSGQDLPLQSQDYLHDFFDNQHYGREFVTINEEDETYLKDLEYKTRYYHFFIKSLSDTNHSISHYWHYFLHGVVIEAQRILGIKRKYPFELKKSLHFVSVSREFISYLLSQKDFIRKTFAHTLCADEIFLQSILWNSPFRERLYIPEKDCPGSLRRIQWINHKARIWKIEDYQHLVSRPELFALKFTSQDRDILLKLADHNNCLSAVQSVFETTEL